MLRTSELVSRPEDVQVPATGHLLGFLEAQLVRQVLQFLHLGDELLGGQFRVFWTGFNEMLGNR